MGKGLLIFLSLYVQFANASEDTVTCFEKNELELAREVRAAVNTKGRPYWSNEKLYENPVVLLPASQKAYPVLHVEKAQLESFGFAVKPCKEDVSFIALVQEEIPAPANGSFDFYFENDQRNNAVGRIARSLSKFSMAYSLTPAWPEPVPRGTVARVAAHEAFHGAFQFSGGFTTDIEEFKKHPRKKAMICSEAAEESVWQRTFLQEVSLLQSMRTDWYNLSSAQIRERAISMLNLRVNATDPYTKECYDHLSFTERIEGTAHYVDLLSGLRVNAFEKNQMPAKEPLDGGPTMRFYATGAMQCRILERLFPNQWQERVNRGERPADILAELLGLKTK